MKAMILAAGLGTRLRPWTLSHPKALVPVEGVPMLERVILRLKEEGFQDIVVNIHHFGDQILDFLRSKDFGIKVSISDERGSLLDTGGGIVHARALLGSEPVLIHNVDILSTAGLSDLMRQHETSRADGTLLVSGRDSTRKLIFNKDMSLKGWHHLGDNLYKPEGYRPAGEVDEYAFSGIYVTSGPMREEMEMMYGERAFPVMDYLLSAERRSDIRGVMQPDLRMLDIGKPGALMSAAAWLKGESQS